MYSCIYMLARCIYTGIEPLVWRVCVHVSLSLSLKKMLYSTRLQVQERPPKDTQLE